MISICAVPGEKTATLAVAVRLPKLGGSVAVMVGDPADIPITAKGAEG
jgi:hypothetical protein